MTLGYEFSQILVTNIPQFFLPCSTVKETPLGPRPLIRMPSGKGNFFPPSRIAFNACITGNSNNNFEFLSLNSSVCVYIQNKTYFLLLVYLV